jgi:hypothetical protein
MFQEEFVLLKLGTKVRFKSNRCRNIPCIDNAIGEVQGLVQESGLAGPIYIVRFDSLFKTPYGYWNSFALDHCYLEVID